MFDAVVALLAHRMRMNLRQAGPQVRAQLRAQLRP
jgi:hypothetical protein